LVEEFFSFRGGEQGLSPPPDRRRFSRVGGFCAVFFFFLLFFFFFLVCFVFFGGLWVIFFFVFCLCCFFSIFFGALCSKAPRGVDKGEKQGPSNPKTPFLPCVFFGSPPPTFFPFGFPYGTPPFVSPFWTFLGLCGNDWMKLWFGLTSFSRGFQSWVLCRGEAVPSVCRGNVNTHLFLPNKRTHQFPGCPPSDFLMASPPKHTHTNSVFPLLWTNRCCLLVVPHAKNVRIRPTFGFLTPGLSGPKFCYLPKLWGFEPGFLSLAFPGHTLLPKPHLLSIFFCWFLVVACCLRCGGGFVCCVFVELTIQFSPLFVFLFYRWDLFEPKAQVFGAFSFFVFLWGLLVFCGFVCHEFFGFVVFLLYPMPPHVNMETFPSTKTPSPVTPLWPCWVPPLPQGRAGLWFFRGRSWP